MDQVWASGWRHFGRHFFRYSTQPASDGSLQTITPLRIDLASCTFTKSQRRVLNKNYDLRSEIVPAAIDGEPEEPVVFGRPIDAVAAARQLTRAGREQRVGVFAIAEKDPAVRGCHQDAALDFV